MFVWLCFAIVVVGASAMPPKAGLNPSPDRSFHHSVRKDAPPVDSAKRQARQAEDPNCPLGCPKGWKRFGLSTNCYKLPPEPAEGNTFWEWDRRCKADEATSYVIVINGVLEQLAATAVALLYAPTWIPNLGTSFLWIGGYINNDQRWRFLDGTDQTGGVLFFAAGISTAVGGFTNNTCLSGDPWTLGLWQTRPCQSMAGSAICEMPMKHTCDSQLASYIPIPPIDLTQLGNLFPKWPSVPYLDQIVSGLSSAVGYVGSSIKCFFWSCPATGSDTGSTPPPNWHWGCPDGWTSYGGFNASTSRCYKLPDFQSDVMNNIWKGQTSQKMKFWDAEKVCTTLDPSAHLMVINELTELSLVGGILRTFQWQLSNPGAFLWLGQWAKEGWKYLDGTDKQIHIPMSFALGNLERVPANGICLAADLSNGGGWFQAPCDFPNGLFICEMSRKQINTIKSIDISFIQTPPLTRQTLNTLFPKMPEPPFLDYALNSQADQPANDQFVAQTSISDGGPTYSWVMCVRAGTNLWTKLDAYPDWDWLKPNGKYVTTAGRWVYKPCNLDTSTKTEWVFKLTKAMSALNTWSLCYNDGYELAMPVYAATDSLIGGIPGVAAAASKLSGWYPYQVGNQTGEFYANYHKSFWQTTAYWKIPQSAQQCPK